VGPLISRKNTEKLFMAIGLQTIEMAPGNEYVAVVSIRGRSQNDVNLTVDFTSQGKFKKRVYNKEVPSHMVPHLNNLDTFSAMKYSV
jgi:hypothetical protein